MKQKHEYGIRSQCRVGRQVYVGTPVHSIGLCVIAAFCSICGEGWIMSDRGRRALGFRRTPQTHPFSNPSRSLQGFPSAAATRPAARLQDASSLVPPISLATQQIADNYTGLARILRYPQPRGHPEFKVQFKRNVTVSFRGPFTRKAGAILP